MSSNEEALRLYAHQVVRDLCLALAELIELNENDPLDTATNEHVNALAAGREFLVITEVSVDPLIGSLTELLRDLVADILGSQDMRAMPAPLIEEREAEHVAQARWMIDALEGKL